MSDIDYLVISSTMDFSTDYVCLEMKKRELKYLRINRDRFRDYRLKYDIEKEELTIVVDEYEYIVSKKQLKAVYFRAPVFLRNYKTYTVEEQLYRSQWSSFVRNLMVFSNARWINHPVDIYRGENKILQLDIAKEVGLEIPQTVVTNRETALSGLNDCVIKALDTPLFYENGIEMFTYSTVVEQSDKRYVSIKDAPVIVQECIHEKMDYRITVVGNRLYSAIITKKGVGIEGDWRKNRKEDLEYRFSPLPYEMEEKILGFMKKMKLPFGGIDLAYSKGKFYFLEVNPTGEWGWLVRTVGFDVYKSIVDWMTKEI